jgi:site-specific recombinase XerD
MMRTLAEVSQRIDLSPIENSQLAQSTEDKYMRSIERYMEIGEDFNNIDVLVKYAKGLGDSSSAQFKAALSVLAKDMELKAKAGATLENINQVQSVVYRLEAITESVKVKKSTSAKFGRWISAKQVNEIYDLCRSERNSLKRMRDLVHFKLLFKTGCQREETTKIQFRDLTQRSIKSRTVTVVKIHGKGRKEQAISINNEAADLIAAWHV